MLHEPQILFGCWNHDPLLTRPEFLPVWRGESVWTLTPVCESVGVTWACLAFRGEHKVFKLHSESILATRFIWKSPRWRCWRQSGYVCVRKPERWLSREILLQQLIFRNMIKQIPAIYPHLCHSSWGLQTGKHRKAFQFACMERSDLINNDAGEPFVVSVACRQTDTVWTQSSKCLNSLPQNQIWLPHWVFINFPTLTLFVWWRFTYHLIP